jgi:hypothetical protein
MAQVPSAVAQAAGAFGLDAGSLRALGGNSGSAWGAARARRGEPGWAALLDGWAESAALHDVPAVHRAWACAFMLRDLARRYTADELKHVAAALEDARADGSGQRG